MANKSNLSGGQIFFQTSLSEIKTLTLVLEGLKGWLGFTQNARNTGGMDVTFGTILRYSALRFDAISDRPCVQTNLYL